MYNVLAEKITYGRRTYKKGDPVSNKQIPDKLLKELEKAGKIGKESKGTTKK